MEKSPGKEYACAIRGAGVVAERHPGVPVDEIFLAKQLRRVSHAQRINSLK